MTDATFSAQEIETVRAHAATLRERGMGQTAAVLENLADELLAARQALARANAANSRLAQANHELRAKVGGGKP